MSKIRAVRNDGREYSQAEGNLKVILRMISSLPESKTRQIIISKSELNSLMEEKQMERRKLYKVNQYDVMSRMVMKGRICKIKDDAEIEIFYVDISDIDHYILEKILIDGNVVYIAPQSMEIANEGLMLLTI